MNRSGKPEWSPDWARVGKLARAQVLTFQGDTAFCYEATVALTDLVVEWCVGTCEARHEGGTVWAIDSTSHACMANGGVRIPANAGSERGAVALAEHLAATMIRELLGATGIVEGRVRWANIPADKLREHFAERTVH